MHDISPNIKCNCQKQNVFTIGQIQLEGNGFNTKMEKDKRY